MEFNPRNNKFISPAPNHLIAWVGHMTPSELTEYLFEPGGCSDNVPHSEFMSDLGRFFDHDRILAHAVELPIILRELAKNANVQDQVLVEELEKRLGVEEKIHCFLILWDFKLNQPFTSNFAQGRLQLVGS